MDFSGIDNKVAAVATAVDVFDDDEPTQTTALAIPEPHPGFDAAGKKKRVRKPLPEPVNAQQKRERLKTAILASVSPLDVRDIVLKAVAQAKAGDRYARDWIFDRLIGKSVSYAEVTVENHTITPDEAKARLDAILKIDSAGVPAIVGV